jgi:hypothetical protein
MQHWMRYENVTVDQQGEVCKNITVGYFYQLLYLPSIEWDVKGLAYIRQTEANHKRTSKCLQTK